MNLMMTVFIMMLAVVAAVPVAPETRLTKLEQKVKMLELGRRLANLEGVKEDPLVKEERVHCHNCCYERKRGNCPGPNCPWYCQ